MINQVIMGVMAAGAVLGGIDWIFGNKRGYGKKMEEALMLLGPTALSMAGIICLVPFLAKTLGGAVSPLYRMAGMDPGMFGGLVAIDMGGFQLASAMADRPEIAMYAGIIAGAVFGCTLVFTIPMGMGMLSGRDQEIFAKGIMTGLGAMPAALLVGGLAAGLSLREIVWQNLPFLFLAAVIAIGLNVFPKELLKCFRAFAAGIRVLSIAGISLGAAAYMLELSPEWLTPLKEAMATVSSIGIVLLGSLPAAEFIQRVLRNPLKKLGEKWGMNPVSSAGLLICLVSPVPVLAMMKEMDEKGKLVNSACMVCGASMLAAHLGFTVSAAPQMLGALLAAKSVGALVGAAAGMAQRR